MESTPRVTDLDPEHAARLHENLGSAKGLLAMKTQDKSLALAAIEHARAVAHGAATVILPVLALLATLLWGWLP